MARGGPILAPEGSLGRADSSGFLLGVAWQTSVWEQTTRELGPSPGGLRFYLDRPVDLVVLIEGRGVDSDLPCGVKINSLEEKTITLSPEFTTHRLEVPRSALHVGENRVVLTASGTTEWRQFEVLPRGGHFENEVNGEKLNLGYVNSLSYPVTLPTGSLLVIDRLEPWVQAGAPTAPEPELKVRLQHEETGLDKEWELTGEGPHRLSLPAVSEASLQFLTPALESPLPGQRGIRLLRPRIEFRGSREIRHAPARSTSEKGKKPPNVVIYMVDTLRADHLSVYGYQKPTSPRLQEFAAQSVVFEDVVAEAPWTKPSTCTVLTGLPSLAHGAIGFADKLPHQVNTLAETFSQNGYATAGYFTNSAASPAVGLDQGFDVAKLLLGLPSSEVNDEVFDWLQGLDLDRPFFLYVHTMDPHAPYTPPPVVLQQWCPQRSQGFSDDDIVALSAQTVAQRPVLGTAPEPPPGLDELIGSYDAEVAANDAAFGELLARLREADLYDDTLILFLSDHGEELFDHQWYWHVHTLYQELLAVPWVMKLPEQEGAGTRVSGMWRHLDVAPTVLSLAGLPVPSEMVGRRFSVGLETSESPPAMSYVKAGADAAIAGQFSRPFSLHCESIREGRYQLILAKEQLLHRMEPIELYDLSEDPQQRRNLAWDMPAKTLHLITLLELHRSRYDRGVTPEAASAEEVEKMLRNLNYMQ